ncbi:MAG: hypothetical protein IJB94_07145, partial [Clostridia bacterium]|nr:hypothetical protein [Clostridia bacterium]
MHSKHNSATDEGCFAEDIYSHKKAKRIKEIKTLRAEDRAVFEMSDGSKQAVFYPGAVFAPDPQSGTPKEIDNSLIQAGDHRYFTNKHGNFLARFSNEQKTDELFFIEKNGHSITVSVRKTNTDKQDRYRPQPKKKRTSVSHKNPHEALLFPEVSSDTDMEYTLSNNGIKENIIVKKPQRAYHYRFWLDCKNLTPSFDAQTKAILFLDPISEEPVFEIPAPFMVDAAGARSENVVYDMKHIGGRIAFTVSAKSTWLNAPERAFPVIIDPQINAVYSTSGSLLAVTQHIDEIIPACGSNNACCECPDECCCDNNTQEEPCEE